MVLLGIATGRLRPVLPEDVEAFLENFPSALHFPYLSTDNWQSLSKDGISFHGTFKTVISMSKGIPLTLKGLK